MKIYIIKTISFLLLSISLAIPSFLFLSLEKCNYKIISKNKITSKLIKEAQSLEYSNPNEINKAVFEYDDFLKGNLLFSSFFLILGLMFYLKTIKKPNGIVVNSLAIGVFCDLIFIVFLSFGAYFFISIFLNLLFGVNPYLFESINSIIISFGYFIALVICGRFALNFSLQGILVNKEGVKINYPGSFQKIFWNDLKKIKLYDNTMLSPDKSQIKLLFKTNKDIFSIFEPSKKETKIEIINKLKENAPFKFQQELDKILAKW